MIRALYKCTTYTYNCSFVYYGQTERSLKTRITEHKRAVAMFDHDSKMACHVHENNHEMDFGSFRVVSGYVFKKLHEDFFIRARSTCCYLTDAWYRYIATDEGLSTS